MRHDFAEATVELYAVHNTIRKTAPFNDKKLDVMATFLRDRLWRERILGSRRRGIV